MKTFQDLYLFNVITYYMKSGTHIAEQVSICFYKAYTFQCFPQDFVRHVAAGDVTLICIFMTSLRQVCVQMSFRHFRSVVL